LRAVYARHPCWSWCNHDSDVSSWSGGQW